MDEVALFPAGVFFVPLANVSSAETLSSTILQALAVPLRGSVEPQRQLLDHLADRRLLLVLDNFEQLLSRAENRGESGETDARGKEQETAARSQAAGTRRGHRTGQSYWLRSYGMHRGSSCW